MLFFRTVLETIQRRLAFLQFCDASVTTYLLTYLQWIGGREERSVCVDTHASPPSPRVLSNSARVV